MRGNKGVFYCHFIATYCHTQKRSIRHDEEWHIDLFGGCYCISLLFSSFTVVPDVPFIHFEFEGR